MTQLQGVNNLFNTSWISNSLVDTYAYLNVIHWQDVM
jgi:hypothetical protein